MEDTRLVVFKFLFLFLCVLLFFLLAFFFFGMVSINSAVRYFLIEAYPFSLTISQMEIFVAPYLPKECLLNKYPVSPCEVSKTLRIFKKLYLLN